MDLYFSIAFVIFLLFMSGFFSGSETAMTAASRPRLHRLATGGNKRAKTVNSLRKDSEQLIGAILLGNNFVNILASAFTTSVLLDLFGDAAIVYTTIAMTLLVLIFSEVLPKTIALNKPDEIALLVAPFIRAVVVVFSPVSRLVQIIVRLVLRVFGVKTDNAIGDAVSDDELRGAIELHAQWDESLPEERHMLHAVLDLDEVEVEDIMIHRSQLVMIDIDQPNEKIVDQVLAAAYTRIPVYKSDTENVIGVLHAKELMRALRAVDNDADKVDITSIVSEPWFIHEYTSLLDQLQAFKTRGEHFAIVIDEYGSLMGIVTLEDILEEIVGDITDEHDVNVEGVKAQSDGSFLVDGTVTLRDLNRNFHWSLPDDDASTIAGLIMHEARDIPEPGQMFEFYGYRFKILRRHRNQVMLVRVTPPKRTKAIAA